MAGSTSARPPVPAPLSALALRARLLVFLRPCSRLPRCWLRRRQPQLLQFPQRPPPARKSTIGSGARKVRADKQMLVQANEINYDYANNRVAAVGNVQIYFTGVDARSQPGHLRSEDQAAARRRQRPAHRGGRQDHLWRDHGSAATITATALSTRCALMLPIRRGWPPQRADRSSGNFTVFHSGVYTACEPCKDDPKKPPLWQVKAARIIHDQGEKMIYFERRAARIFRHAARLLSLLLGARSDGQAQDRLSDAAVLLQLEIRPRRRNSLLLGARARLTTSRSRRSSRPSRARCCRGEWRHRLVNGAYSIRAAGIYQLDKDVFLRDDGRSDARLTDWRGSLESSGQFALNDKWVWGWDAVVLSDPTFFQDYGRLEILAPA